MGKAFECFSPDQLAKYLLPEPDLLHLSKQGHIIYADHIYSYIEKGLIKLCKT
jgi:lysophospholipase L1-like esterase